LRFRITAHRREIAKIHWTKPADPTIVNRTEYRPYGDSTETGESQKVCGGIVFVAGAVLSWGAYGAMLHMGQTQLGNPLKALLCVGVAYFLMNTGARRCSWQPGSA
jgi:hypothetical protein